MGITQQTTEAGPGSTVGGDQLLEILVTTVAPAALEVAHKRGAINRGENLRVTTDAHVSVRITRMLGKFRGCRLAEFACHTTIQPYPGALDVSPGRFPDLNRFGIIAKFETDFLDDPVGLLFQFDDAFLAKKLVKRNLTFNVCRRDWLLTFARATAAAASA